MRQRTARAYAAGMRHGITVAGGDASMRAHAPALDAPWVAAVGGKGAGRGRSRGVEGAEIALAGEDERTWSARSRWRTVG